MQVFRDYSVLFTLYNTGELSCNWMGTNGFKVNIENEWFIVVCSPCYYIVNRGEWFGSSANIKGANKDAKI